MDFDYVDRRCFWSGSKGISEKDEKLMSDQNCVLCRYTAPVESYDLSALKINLEMFKFCDQHKQEVEQRILVLSKPVPKKYVLNQEPKVFMPPKTVSNNFQDVEREPNNGELIE